MDKNMARRIVTGVCHSDPRTARGEYCLTLDELVAFGSAAESVERKACIAAIRQAYDCCCGIPCDCFGAAIGAIKMRSNA